MIDFAALRYAALCASLPVTPAEEEAMDALAADDTCPNNFGTGSAATAVGVVHGDGHGRRESHTTDAAERCAPTTTGAPAHPFAGAPTIFGGAR